MNSFAERANPLFHNESSFGNGRWLRGREFDSGLRGCGLEPHQRPCVVFLSKTLYPMLSTGSTQEDLSRHD